METTQFIEGQVLIVLAVIFFAWMAWHWKKM